MKLFKFLAVFAVVLGVVYIIVIGLNLNVFKTVFTNQEALAEGSEWIEKTYSLSGMVDYIHAHPDLVSVTLTPVEAFQGDSVDTAIRFGENQPRVMAGIGHLVLLGTYAELVSRGDLSPDSCISRADIERFLVPGVEPNRHRESMRLLESASGNNQSFRLNDIVEVMVLRNHQPSADLLYALLGADAIAAFLEKYSDGGIQLPSMWSAFHLAVVGSGQTRLIEGNQDDYTLLYENNVVRLTDNRSDAATILNALGPKKIDYSFFEEKYAYRNLPVALPSSLAGLLNTLLNDNSVDARMRAVVVSHMDWPMQDPKVMRDFEVLYAMYDNRISISHGIAFGTSAYTQRTHISTVFFDSLPVGFWMHMSSNLINQDYQLRLMYDPALYDRTYNMLMLSESHEDQPETIHEE